MHERIERARIPYARWTATYMGLKPLALLALCAVFSDCIFAVESKRTGGVVVKTAAGPVQGETDLHSCPHPRLLHQVQ
jgi:hypothetical protein